MSLSRNEQNRTPSDHESKLSSGVADSIGSAAASAHAALEDLHSVTVWDLPAELAENEGRHELECNTCGVIGAIADHELAIKAAALHTDFLGPLRDLAEVR